MGSNPLERYYLQANRPLIPAPIIAITSFIFLSVIQICHCVIGDDTFAPPFFCYNVDLDVEACFDTPIWISFTILDNWMWKYSSQADTSTDPDIPNIKRQSISELEGDAIVDGCNCESEHLSGSEVPPQFLSSRYLPKFL
ncbi:hypothetical protein P3L10_026852 [Capsicum annuum]